MENTFKYIETFKEKLDEYDNIYLTAHINPDGDSIGSALALAYFLKNKMNKNVTVALKDNIPTSFKFLPGIDHIVTDTSKIESIDLLITVDCASKDRLALNKSLLDNAKYIINIDHHVTNTRFGDLNFVNSSASSTGEVLYEMIKALGYEINKDIATCLYVSISTDTGSFKYTNTTSNTHLIASKLLEQGIDLETINIELYQKRSLEKTMLLMQSMRDLTLLENNTVGIVAVDQEMLKTSGAKIQDSEIIVDFIRNIDSINLACVLRPIGENTTKASMRSKKNIDVSKIALVFGGGGHAKAAGCTINANISEAKKIITDEILKYLGE